MKVKRVTREIIEKKGDIVIRQIALPSNVFEYEVLCDCGHINTNLRVNITKRVKEDKPTTKRINTAISCMKCGKFHSIDDIDLRLGVPHIDWEYNEEELTIEGD